MRKVINSFFIFLVLILVVSSGEVFAAANLTLEPSSGIYNKDSVFQVKVMVDTGREYVNAVQANISYPSDKLEFLNISTEGSILTTFADKYTKDGVVKISGGRPTPGFSGNKLLVSVSFKVKADSGSGMLSINADSVVLRNSDNLNILYGKTGANYIFAGSFAGSAPTYTQEDTTFEEESPIEPNQQEEAASPALTASSNEEGSTSVWPVLLIILLVVGGGLGFGFWWFKIRNRNLPPTV